MEAQNEIHTKEKEKLIDKIQEMQEASDHLKKQFETESEVKSNFWQEASRLTLENRVRSLLTWWWRLSVCKWRWKGGRAA